MGKPLEKLQGDESNPNPVSGIELDGLLHRVREGFAMPQ
jgi:hypothetical protein